MIAIKLCGASRGSLGNLGALVVELRAGWAVIGLEDIFPRLKVDTKGEYEFLSQDAV